jgi:hypothetical protein
MKRRTDPLIAIPWIGWRNPTSLVLARDRGIRQLKTVGQRKSACTHSIIVFHNDLCRSSLSHHTRNGTIVDAALLSALITNIRSKLGFS